MRRRSPLPVRQVIRTERPGGSAFVPLFPDAGCGVPPEAVAVGPMAPSRRSLPQWRHAGHSRRARGARRRDAPVRLRGVRGPRRRLRSPVAPARADSVLADRADRVPAPAWPSRGLVAGRRGRGVRLQHCAGGRVPAAGGAALGEHLLGHRRDRAAVSLVRRRRPGRRCRPGRAVPFRSARTRLRARRHLDGGAGRLPAAAPPGGQPGRHLVGRRPGRQRGADRVPGPSCAGPGAAGRSRGGRVPHQSGLDAHRGGPARAALPAYRRGPATADPLAAVWHRGVAQPVAPGGRALAAGRPGQHSGQRDERTVVRPGRGHHAGIGARGTLLHRGIRHRRARPTRVRPSCPAGVDWRHARSPGGPGRRAGQPGRAGRHRGGGRRGRRGGRPGRSAPAGAGHRPLGARRAAGGLRQPQPPR